MPAPLVSSGRGLLDPEDEGTMILPSAWITHPMTQCHLTKHLNLQQHRQNIKSSKQLRYFHYMELHEISKRKANWIGHILRRNCLLQRVIEGKIKGEMEVARRRGRRRKTLRCVIPVVCVTNEKEENVVKQHN